MSSRQLRAASHADSVMLVHFPDRKNDRQDCNGATGPRAQVKARTKLG